MNRLNVQTARRLQHLGKQPPREGQLIFAWWLTRQLEQSIVEFGFFKGHPLFQSLADTVSHFRSGGLGKGQSKDFPRLSPFE